MTGSHFQRPPASAVPPSQRVAFWKGLTAHLDERDDLTCGKATSESWLFHNGSLNFGSLFSVARWRRGELRAQFALEGPSAAGVYSFLLDHRAEIDSRFESAPLWRSPQGSQTWLLETVRAGDLADEREWPALWVWLEGELTTLQAACRPLVGWVPPPATGRRAWDERLFFAELERWNPGALPPASELLAAAQTMMPDLAWGHGAQVGSVTAGLRHGGAVYRLVELRTSGTVALLLRKLTALPAYGGSAPRHELLRRLNQVPHLHYSDDALGTCPALPLPVLAEPGAMTAFVAVLRWFAETARAG